MVPNWHIFSKSIVAHSRDETSLSVLKVDCIGMFFPDFDDQENSNPSCVEPALCLWASWRRCCPHVHASHTELISLASFLRLGLALLPPRILVQLLRLGESGWGSLQLQPE